MKGRALRMTLIAGSVSVLLAAACTRGRLNFLQSSHVAAAQGEAAPDTIYQTSDTRLRLSNREFVRSRLDGVFGPAAGGSATASLIANAISEMGGPCDPFQSAHSVGTGVDPGYDGCAIGSDSQAAVIPTAATPRLSLTYRVCELLTSDDEAIRFAAREALDENGTGSDPTVAPPTPAQLAQAYDLFYPGHAYPDDTVGVALRALVQSAHDQGMPPLEAWRFTFYSLCMAPDWQVL